MQRFYGICEKYRPEQDWMFDADELTDRSERFMAAEMVREAVPPDRRRTALHLDRHDRQVRGGRGKLRRIAATIVVERDGHKGMVIGEEGRSLKRIGTEARQNSTGLWDCKVFLELWVKGALGLGRRRARVRSFGYE